MCIERIQLGAFSDMLLGFPKAMVFGSPRPYNQLMGFESWFCHLWNFEHNT